MNRLYQSALSEGLWENTYAISNKEEYWAEGVQRYFDVNIGTNPANGVHNQIDTREELAEYDPELFAFIDTFFLGYQWTPGCPRVKIVD